jgi:hypothetical protein
MIKVANTIHNANREESRLKTKNHPNKISFLSLVKKSKIGEI